MSMVKLAGAIGMSLQDLKDYEYQPTVWNHRIFAIGEDYYTITKSERPPRVKGKWASDQWDMQWKRVEPAALHLAPEGLTVWVCSATDEAK